jgi:hypothetical protein
VHPDRKKLAARHQSRHQSGRCSAFRSGLASGGWPGRDVLQLVRHALHLRLGDQVLKGLSQFRDAGVVGCASRIGTSNVARHEIAHQRADQRRPRFNRHDVIRFGHSRLLTGERGAADSSRRAHDVADETTSCAAPARLRIGEAID